MHARLLRRIGRPAALGPVGAVGMVLGHWIAYSLAAPRARVRTRLLASTGHAYWFLAVRIALVCALASVAAVLIRATVERLRGRPTAPSGPGPAALALAVIQVGGYGAMEVVERLVAKAPLSTLLVHDVLVLGVLIQVGLAGLLSFALWSLRRAADRLTALAVAVSPGGARRQVAVVTIPQARIRPLR